MVTVIFPAAGHGKRMRAKCNKIFLKLCGISILEHTLRRFSNCDAIDDMIIVAAPEEVDFLSSILATMQGIKPYKVVAGGSERQYSIANGLQYLSAMSDIVLIHDMARPLVTDSVIKAVIEEAKSAGAAIAAVPEKNTIKIVNNERQVKDTPDRSTLWAVQTPQGFKRDIIIKAYEAAAKEAFLGTDDASLVERLGLTVKVVESNYANIKVTTPEDIIIAEAFLQVK